MTLFTLPQLTMIEQPLDLSYQGKPATLRQGNYSHEYVEHLQRQWLKSGLAPVVRTFRKRLEDSFDEYNLKFVLNKLQTLLLPADIGEDDFTTAEIRALKKRVPWQCFNALDSAYYCRANGLAGAAKPFWEELSRSDYGFFFTIMPD